MKYLIATLILAAAPAMAIAQTAAPAKPAAKPTATAKPAAARPQARPQAASPRKPNAAQAKAIEESVPIEEPDPSIKLTEAELEIAKKIHVGEFPCELGANVRIRALRREGFFLVQNKLNRFVMHPVESRTGAIRLEDPMRGALFLQLGNKSMLMSQKLGQRLADECQSPEQATFAADMKNRPAVNLLEAPKTEPAKSGPD
ncbi:hypothetical protein [Ramlibacter sp.]|uniref:hypothetical protein n=1 Tax=Ramlibacter sp. TaxID=1917967 RepID=UPI003D0F3A55